MVLVDEACDGLSALYRANEPLGVRVAVGAPRRDLGHGDVLAGEDAVESCGEFRVPVADQVSEVASMLVELPYQLSGLLGGPGGGGVGGDAQDVHGAGAYLHDEQGVQPLQADGVHVEEVGGEQAVGLGLEEGGPFAAHGMLARGWAEAGGAQDPADAGRTDPVPQATEFAVDAPEAPSWDFGAELDDQVFVPGREWCSPPVQDLLERRLSSARR
ncbi:hypothetical protein [Streptomyces sp. NPDC002676]